MIAGSIGRRPGVFQTELPGERPVIPVILIPSSPLGVAAEEQARGLGEFDPPEREEHADRPCAMRRRRLGPGEAGKRAQGRTSSSGKCWRV